MATHLINSVQCHTSMRVAAPNTSSTWHSVAIDAFIHGEHDDVAALRVDLAARVAALTGQPIAPETITIARASKQARIAVDGVRFQLQNGELSILRTCVECGLTTHASPPISSRADLGYALAGWQPRGNCCTPDEDEDWALW